MIPMGIIASSILKGSGSVGDPYWDDVLVYLPMTGTVDSTSFPDVKGLVTWTATGNSKVSNAQAKFGTTSAILDGAGDAITADVTLMGFQDFTFEGFMYAKSWYTDTSWGRYIYSQYNNSTGDFSTARMLFGFPENGANAGKLYFYHPSCGAKYSASTVTLNAWHFFQMIRNGTALEIYLDGALVISATISGTFSISAGRVGGALYGGAIQGSWDGHLNYFRLTEAVRTDHTVPTAPYPTLGPWTPSQLTLAQWIDVSDAATITESAGAISQISDKSGNSRHATQGTAGNKPSLQSAVQNGLNIARFDGTDDGFAIDVPHASTMRVIGVFRTPSLQTGYRSFLNRVTGSAPFPPALYFSDAFATDRNSVFWGSIIQVVSPTVATTAFIHEWDMVSGSTAGCRLDGGTRAGAAHSETAISSWNFIGAPSGVQAAAFDLCEYFIVNAAMTDTERQKAEGYLAHKWGLLAQLPSDHPYKSIAPTT